MTRRDQVRAIVRGELPDRVPTLLECPMDATVDILNSAGPSDHNDLKRFKRRWGDRITIQGGIRSKIADMDEGAMRAHVFDVVNTGRIGGRFFPRSESGVPPMSAERGTAGGRGRRVRAARAGRKDERPMKTAILVKRELIGRIFPEDALEGIRALGPVALFDADRDPSPGEAAELCPARGLSSPAGAARASRG